MPSAETFQRPIVMEQAGLPPTTAQLNPELSTQEHQTNPDDLLSLSEYVQKYFETTETVYEKSPPKKSKNSKSYIRLTHESKQHSKDVFNQFLNRAGWENLAQEIEGFKEDIRMMEKSEKRTALYRYATALNLRLAHHLRSQERKAVGLPENSTPLGVDQIAEALTIEPEDEEGSVQTKAEIPTQEQSEGEPSPESGIEEPVADEAVIVEEGEIAEIGTTLTLSNNRVEEQPTQANEPSEPTVIEDFVTTNIEAIKKAGELAQANLIKRLFSSKPHEYGNMMKMITRMYPDLPTERKNELAYQLAFIAIDQPALRFSREIAVQYVDAIYKATGQEQLKAVNVENGIFDKKMDRRKAVITGALGASSIAGIVYGKKGIFNAVDKVADLLGPSTSLELQQNSSSVENTAINSGTEQSRDQIDRQRFQDTISDRQQQLDSHKEAVQNQQQLAHQKEAQQIAQEQAVLIEKAKLEIAEAPQIESLKNSIVLYGEQGNFAGDYSQQTIEQQLSPEILEKAAELKMIIEQKIDETEGHFGITLTEGTWNFLYTHSNGSLDPEVITVDINPSKNIHNMTLSEQEIAEIKAQEPDEQKQKEIIQQRIEDKKFHHLDTHMFEPFTSTDTVSIETSGWTVNAEGNVLIRLQNCYVENGHKAKPGQKGGGVYVEVPLEQAINLAKNGSQRFSSVACWDMYKQEKIRNLYTGLHHTAQQGRELSSLSMVDLIRLNNKHVLSQQYGDWWGLSGGREVPMRAAGVCGMAAVTGSAILQAGLHTESLSWVKANGHSPGYEYWAASTSADINMQDEKGRYYVQDSTVVTDEKGRAVKDLALELEQGTTMRISPHVLYCRPNNNEGKPLMLFISEAEVMQTA